MSERTLRILPANVRVGDVRTMDALAYLGPKRLRVWSAPDEQNVVLIADIEIDHYDPQGGRAFTVTLPDGELGTIASQSVGCGCQINPALKAFDPDRQEAPA